MVEPYHKVYIVTSDVFGVSGNAPLTELAPRKPGDRNLLVVPHEITAELQRMKEQGRYGSDGAYLALREFDRLSAGIAPDTSDSHQKGKPKWSRGAPISREGGLDVKFFNSRQDTKNFRMEQVVEMVKGEYANGKGESVVLLTQNTYDLIRYRDAGINAQRPEFLIVDADIVHESVIPGSLELLAALYQANSTLSIEQVEEMLSRSVFPNQFIEFRSGNELLFAKVGGKPTRNGDRILELEPIVRLLTPREGGKELVIGKRRLETILGVGPLDMRQYLALQYILLNPDVTLGFITGESGTGKTLLTYAAAVMQATIWPKEEAELRGLGQKEQQYPRIKLFKPTDIIGGSRRDPGALPGTLYEKLKPSIQSYADCHRETTLGGHVSFEEMLLHSQFKNDIGLPREPDMAERFKKAAGGYPPRHEVIEIEHASFVRGRTFTHTFTFIDEAQNYTPAEIKALLERPGRGCKTIVMGDPYQVDNPFCSPEMNGLTAAIEWFIGDAFSAGVHLTQNYRSQVSDRAREWRTVR